MVESFAAVFKVSELLLLGELLIVLLEVSLVCEIAIGGEGRSLIARLHEFFMNDLVVFLARGFELVTEESLLLASFARVQSVQPGVHTALIRQVIACWDREFHREKGVAYFLLEGRGVVHQLVRDTESLCIDASHWETCQSQEGSDFSRQTAQII